MVELRGLPPGAKGRRLADAPTMSVVVASASDRARLDRCLDALLPQCLQRGVEVVVARSCSREEYAALAAAYPAVLFMPAATGSTIAQLRAVGTSAADGDLVCLTDDAQPIEPDYVVQRLAAWDPDRADGAPALRPFDWSAWFTALGLG